MKVVNVTYTIRAEFSEQNQQNIKHVMKDLQELKHAGIHYHACLSADNKTFIHTAFFQSDSDEKILNNLPAFTYFQEQLKASGPEIPPKQEHLILIAASDAIFHS